MTRRSTRRSARGPASDTMHAGRRRAPDGSVAVPSRGAGTGGLRTFGLALLATIPLVIPGCRDAAARSGMAHARPSAEALVRDALDALEARDREALEALLVTREEHRELLWEELPESGYFSFEYARRLNEHNTGKAIRNALRQFGGARFEVLSVEWTKGREEYSDFTLHRGARVTVRRADNGAEGVLPIFDVAVERNGGWKLLDYEE